MTTQSTHINASVGNTLWLPCSKCHGKTCHKVLASVDKEGKHDYPSHDYEIHFETKYQVVECQGCTSISFRKNETDSEEMLEDESGNWIPVDHEELYPSRVAGRHKLDQASLLPREVENIYNETHFALCNRQQILAGIGLRALVETICKEKQAPGKDLEKKIDSLIDLGVLTPDGAEILHSLRILGNVAAHEVKPHSEQTLGIAMDVVEHLLQGVYILPAVAEKLPRRRA